MENTQNLPVEALNVAELENISGGDAPKELPPPAGPVLGPSGTSKGYPG